MPRAPRRHRPPPRPSRAARSCALRKSGRRAGRSRSSLEHRLQARVFEFGRRPHRPSAAELRRRRRTMHSAARRVPAVAHSSSAATAAASARAGFCAPSMRVDHAAAAAAGAAAGGRCAQIGLRATRTNRSLSVSSSGCRLCQAMDGMSLSWPQCASTSIRTGSASKPSILREAMATWSCTSGDGSRASAADAARESPARRCRSFPRRERPRRGRPGRRARAASRETPAPAARCRSAPTARAAARSAAPASSIARPKRRAQPLIADFARRVPLRQNPLRRFAEVDVPARQPRDQLIVALGGQVELRGARRVAVAQPIEPPLQPVHAAGSRAASCEQ